MRLHINSIMNKKKELISIISILTIFLILSGCLGLKYTGSGRLTQTGSSTVLPLAIAWAEEFDDADITVSGGGSSHGFNALLLGEADLADASRLLKGSDYEKVGGRAEWVNENGTANRGVNGITPVKWTVAFDVVVLVINNKNNWAVELNFQQLYEIFTDDDPARYWDEVPGLDDAPHKEIEIYAPDEASGTFDYFYESIIPNWGKDDQAAGSRLDAGDGVYHPSADDNVILSAVAENEYAIGYFGFAYFVENSKRVTPVALKGDGEEHIQPSFETVSEYPMARPLFIYTNGVPEPGSVINKYFTYILSNEGQEIVSEVGYVKLDTVDEEIINEQLTLL